MPQVAFLFFVFNFGIRNGSIALRAPVYDPFTPVNKPLLEKPYENFPDCQLFPAQSL